MVAITQAVTSDVPPGNGDLADQLRRATSATECAAVLDVARRLEIVAPDHFDEGRAVLFRIVSMLVKMVHGLAR